MKKFFEKFNLFSFISVFILPFILLFIPPFTPASSAYGAGNAFGAESFVKPDKPSSRPSSLILLDYTDEMIKKNFEDVTVEREIIKILNKKGIKKYSDLSFPFSKKTRN